MSTTAINSHAALATPALRMRDWKLRRILDEYTAGWITPITFGELALRRDVTDAKAAMVALMRSFVNANSEGPAWFRTLEAVDDYVALLNENLPSTLVLKMMAVVSKTHKVRHLVMVRRVAKHHAVTEAQSSSAHIAQEGQAVVAGNDTVVDTEANDRAKSESSPVEYTEANYLFLRFAMETGTVYDQAQYREIGEPLVAA